MSLLSRISLLFFYRMSVVKPSVVISLADFPAVSAVFLDTCPQFGDPGQELIQLPHVSRRPVEPKADDLNADGTFVFEHDAAGVLTSEGQFQYHRRLTLYDKAVVLYTADQKGLLQHLLNFTAPHRSMLDSQLTTKAADGTITLGFRDCIQTSNTLRMWQITVAVHLGSSSASKQQSFQATLAFKQGSLSFYDFVQKFREKRVTTYTHFAVKADSLPPDTLVIPADVLFKGFFIHALDQKEHARQIDRSHEDFPDSTADETIERFQKAWLEHAPVLPADFQSKALAAIDGSGGGGGAAGSGGDGGSRTGNKFKIGSRGPFKGPGCSYCFSRGFDNKDHTVLKCFYKQRTESYRSNKSLAVVASNDVPSAPALPVAASAVVVPSDARSITDSFEKGYSQYLEALTAQGRPHPPQALPAILRSALRSAFPLICYDGAASLSIANRLDLLVHAVPLVSPLRIGGVGAGIRLTHVGFWPFLAQYGAGIARCFYSKDATVCLVSLGNMQRHGCSYSTRGSSHLVIRDPTGVEIDCAPMESNNICHVSARAYGRRQQFASADAIVAVCGAGSVAFGTRELSGYPELRTLGCSVVPFPSDVPALLSDSDDDLDDAVSVVDDSDGVPALLDSDSDSDDDPVSGDGAASDVDDSDGVPDLLDSDSDSDDDAAYGDGAVSDGSCVEVVDACALAVGAVQVLPSVFSTHVNAEQRVRLDRVELLHSSVAIHCSDDVLCEALTSGMFARWNLTASDVRLNRRLRGKCVHCTLAKLRHLPAPTSHSPPADRVAQVIHADLHTREARSPGGSMVAIRFHCEFSGDLQYGSAVSKAAKDLDAAFLHMFTTRYTRYGHVVERVCVDSDPAFEALIPLLAARGISLILMSPGSHERRIENLVGSSQLRASAVLSSLPFLLPPQYETYLHRWVADNANALPNERSRPSTPDIIVTGASAPRHADLALSFGSVVVVEASDSRRRVESRNTLTSLPLVPHGEIAVVLGFSHEVPGDFDVLLSNGSIVARRHLVPVNVAPHGWVSRAVPAAPLSPASVHPVHLPMSDSLVVPVAPVGPFSNLAASGSPPPVTVRLSPDVSPASSAVGSPVRLSPDVSPSPVRLSPDVALPRRPVVVVDLAPVHVAPVAPVVLAPVPVPPVAVAPVPVVSASPRKSGRSTQMQTPARYACTSVVDADGFTLVGKASSNRFPPVTTSVVVRLSPDVSSGSPSVSVRLCPDGISFPSVASRIRRDYTGAVKSKSSLPRILPVPQTLSQFQRELSIANAAVNASATVSAARDFKRRVLVAVESQRLAQEAAFPVHLFPDEFTLSDSPRHFSARSPVAYAALPVLKPVRSSKGKERALREVLLDTDHSLIGSTFGNAVEKMQKLTSIGTKVYDSLADLPPGCAVVPTVFIMKMKRNDILTGRIAGCGNHKLTALAASDPGESTFSGVSSNADIMFAASLMQAHSDATGLPLYSADVDVVGGFLNVKRTSPVRLFLRFQPALPHPLAGKFVEAFSAIYGLIESNRLFGEAVNKVLTCGPASYTQCVSAPHTYVTFDRQDPRYRTVLSNYVDDFKTYSTQPKHLAVLVHALQTRFPDLTINEVSTTFLGINSHIHSNNALGFEQSDFVSRLAHTVGVAEWPPLHAISDKDFFRESILAADLLPTDTSTYSSLTGSLIQLESTRDDVRHLISHLCSRNSQPTVGDHNKALLLLSMLYTTRHLGRVYKSSTTRFDVYSDASFGNGTDGRSGSAFFFCHGPNNAPFETCAKMLPCVAPTPTATEYLTASLSCNGILHYRRFSAELGEPQDQPTRLYLDSQTAIDLAKAPELTKKSRFMDVKYHFIRQCVADGEVEIVKVPTGRPTGDFDMASPPLYQRADCLTKLAGPKVTIADRANLLNLHSLPVPPLLRACPAILSASELALLDSSLLPVLVSSIVASPFVVDLVSSDDSDDLVSDLVSPPFVVPAYLEYESTVSGDSLHSIASGSSLSSIVTTSICPYDYPNTSVHFSSPEISVAADDGYASEVSSIQSVSCVSIGVVERFNFAVTASPSLFPDFAHTRAYQRVIAVSQSLSKRPEVLDGIDHEHHLSFSLLGDDIGPSLSSTAPAFLRLGSEHSGVQSTLSRFGFLQSSVLRATEVPAVDGSVVPVILPPLPSEVDLSHSYNNAVDYFPASLVLDDVAADAVLPDSSVDDAFPCMSTDSSEEDVVEDVVEHFEYTPSPLLRIPRLSRRGITFAIAADNTFVSFPAIEYSHCCRRPCPCCSLTCLSCSHHIGIPLCCSFLPACICPSCESDAEWELD